jgi:signal transduction histidine kinase
MDRELDAMGMLDLMVSPGFCVKDGTIVKCNAAAQAILLREGMNIAPMLETGAEEYAEFTGGCLYLVLNISGVRLGASVTRMGDFDVFLPEEDTEQGELQAVALAARELREPLAGIMTTAERLFPMSALRDDAAMQEQAARLNRGLYQMLRIIGNMSDAGRYAAAPAAQLETMDISAFMQEIFTRSRELVAHTGITLRFENLPHSLYTLADSEKLERAVMNILSNALKFTPAGGSIEAKLTRKGKRLYLSVQDSGTGIPDALRGSIHRRYLRQPGIEDSRQGIGLGMVLIRSAAAIHGGTVLIDHPEEAGTRITMTLAIRQNSSGSIRSPLLRIDYAGERDHALLELAESLPAALYENL